MKRKKAPSLGLAEGTGPADPLTVMWFASCMMLLMGNEWSGKRGTVRGKR